MSEDEEKVMFDFSTLGEEEVSKKKIVKKRTKAERKPRQRRGESGYALDIKLTEENLLREFRLPRTTRAGLVRLKLNDLARIFRRTLTFEIDEMLKKLKRQGYLLKDANGWYRLNLRAITSLISIFFFKS